MNFFLEEVYLTHSPLIKKVVMSKAPGLIVYSKQNHILCVLRRLSNMVLQANTSILTATPVIFIKWHPCQIKECVSHSESRYDSKVPLKARSKHRYPKLV